MPPKKEKWEIQFEEYRDTLISHGAIIKDEKALKQAYKFYGEKRMPTRIYQKCVEENGVAATQTAALNQTKNTAKTKTAEATTVAAAKTETKTETETKAETKAEITAAASEQNKRPRKTQRERFEEYKNRLQEKGITIKDEAGLWEKFHTIRGRLDYGQIGEFITFPQRKNHTKPQDNQDSNTSQNHLATAHNGGTNAQNKKDFVQKQPAKPQSEKDEQPQATIGNTFVQLKNSNPQPTIEDKSFAAQWLKPLEEYCQKDLDDNGLPKRSVTAIKADQQSLIVDIVPQESYAAKNPHDKGVRCSFEKTDEQGNIKIDMGSKDGTPPDYEYFQMMMENNRKNGIKVIAFKNIQTDEFRDKLLAAALEFDMKVQDAPKNININAPYLKTLPNKVKIKLGIYNGDITPPHSARNTEKNQQPLPQKSATRPNKQLSNQTIQAFSANQRT